MGKKKAKLGDDLKILAKKVRFEWNKYKVSLIRSDYFMAIQLLKHFCQVVGIQEIWLKEDCPLVGILGVYLPLYLTGEQQGHQGAFDKRPPNNKKGAG